VFGGFALYLIPLRITCMQITFCRSKFRGFLLPFALLVAGGLLTPAAHAQSTTPLAGTSIGNKASATYSDGTGVSRSTQSNTVTTTVTAVPAMNLTDNRSVRSFPTAPVYFTHTVTNTGNAPDSFNLKVALTSGGTSDGTLSGLAIYADANGDGRPDNSTPITVTPVLQPGQSFGVVIGGTVSSSAASNTQDTLNITSTR